MRYTRLRSSFQEHLEDTELKIVSRSARSSFKCIKTFTGRKRRLSIIEESDEYNADNESRRDLEDESPPLKKRLRSATQQQTNYISLEPGSEQGSIHSSESVPSVPTAFVNTKLLKKMDRPVIPSEMSYTWPIPALDPRGRIDCTSDDSAANQLQTQLTDDTKRNLAEDSGSLDDLIRMNVLKSTQIFPPENPVHVPRYIPSSLDLHDPPLSTRSGTEWLARQSLLQFPDNEAEQLEREFEYGYDDNVDSEIIEPQDSLSEVLQRRSTERHEEKTRLKRAAEIQAARGGRINKIISFFLRRDEEGEKWVSEWTNERANERFKTKD